MQISAQEAVYTATNFKALQEIVALIILGGLDLTESQKRAFHTAFTKTIRSLDVCENADKHEQYRVNIAYITVYNATRLLEKAFDVELFEWIQEKIREAEDSEAHLRN
jgi:hypothetical protein